MEYIIIILLVICLIFLCILVFKQNNNQIYHTINNGNDKLLTIIKNYAQQTSQNKLLQQKMENDRFIDFSNNTQVKIDTLRATVSEMSNSLDLRFNNLQQKSDERLVLMNNTIEKKLSVLQSSNEKKLDEMRVTVDEKLQKTLDSRLSESFKIVGDRLEQVHKSLGEMQKLSTGVDDLRKVLGNVKTRGILGEVQLGAILEQVLNNEQYDTNVVTKKGSQDRVEYAVKLPNENGSYVYLPIDAKFPMTAYQDLLEAYELGEKKVIDEKANVLITRIRTFAKDIAKKYIDSPYTTEFAIMFLPIEGMYAEVVRRGMVEELQREKINIAGPTTMAALLNSFQMGFRTLAIQKHSTEVWATLEGVKQEFNKFEVVLKKTQDRMRQTSEELDKLVGTRTNAINRKLRNVHLLNDTQEIDDEF